VFVALYVGQAIVEPTGTVVVGMFVGALELAIATWPEQVDELKHPSWIEYVPQAVTVYVSSLPKLHASSFDAKSAPVALLYRRMYGSPVTPIVSQTNGQVAKHNINTRT